MNEDELNSYECIPHMTSDYPATFLLGSEYRNDMIEMDEKLKEAGVEHILVDPFFRSRGGHFTMVFIVTEKQQQLVAWLLPKNIV